MANLYDFYVNECWWPCGDGAPTEVPQEGPAMRRIISYWARVQPSVNAVRFIKVDGSVESALSYQELHRRAEALGRQLLQMLDRGEDGKPASVLLCYPPGIDFVVAFFACLYSGVVAVPVYPPDPSKLSTDLPRFTRIASTVKAQACLTNNFYQRILHGLNCKLSLHSQRPSSSIASHLQAPLASNGHSHTQPPAAKENELTDEVRKEWRKLRWSSSQELIDRASKNSHGPSLPPLPSDIPHSQVAFLQFTSGSTNHPKGVSVTHGNLLHNVHLCTATFGMDPRDDHRTKHDLRKDSGGEGNGSEEAFVPLFDRPLREFVTFWYNRHSQSRSVLGHNVRTFSWLPVYHDLGLIGLVGGTLFFGSEMIMMSPLDFVRRPWSWLQGLTKWECEVTAAPNFAYDLVSRKTPEDIRKSLDLSKASWLCGAEPIRYSSIKNFMDTFREVGVRHSAFLPAFGLAENTLCVTGFRPSLDAEPLVLSINALEIETNGNVRIEEEWYGFRPSWTDTSERKIIIGCRLPATDTTVAIVDSSTHHLLPEGQVGEVWLSSPSTAKGYFGMAEQTHQTFRATLSGTTNAPEQQGPFLRTGDTGFLYKGELFIAGRAKDMIIVRGRKYIPQDIEEAIEAKCDVVRPGCCAAFPVESEQGEGMGIACELRPEGVRALAMAGGAKGSSKRASRRHFGGFGRFVSMLACTTDRHGDKDAVLRTIAEEVARAASMKVGLPVQQIWLLKPRVLPKTTSGKLQRSKAKQMLQRSRANGKGGVMWCEDLCTAAAPADTVVKTAKSTPRNAPCPSVLTDASTRSLSTLTPSTLTPSSFRSSTDTRASSVQPTSPTDPFRPSSTNDTGKTALADSLASVAHSVVGGEERPSPSGRLLDLGLDSIGMTEFSEHVRRMTGIDMPPSSMFDNPSLDALAGQLVAKREQEGVMEPIAPFSGHRDGATNNTESSGSNATDDGTTRKRDPETDVNKVAKSFKFDVASLPAPHPQPRKSRHVLVTDATSAVGRFLTVALLQAKERLTVHCLVQTNSDEEGLRQVREACQEAGIWKDEYQSRLMIVPGHVTRRHLGLKPNHLAEHFFAELCERIDLVFHTGFANGQSFMQSYDRLRENTFAMKEIVRLCTTSKLKPLHFVSSLTLFPEYVLGQGKELREATTLDTKRLREVCPPEQFGLPWTNWSTEQVLKKARARGLPCTIYRVPSGMTSLMTGYVDERHVGGALMMAMLEEGEMPPVVKAPLATPVDVVAAMMVRLCLTEKRRHWVYHLANPELITNSEREHWLGDLGVPLKSVSVDHFLATIKKRGAASPLYPLMPLVHRFTSHWCPPHEPRDHLMISTAHLQEDLRRAEWPSAHDLFISCASGEQGRAKVSPRALERAIELSRQLSILMRVDECDEE